MFINLLLEQNLDMTKQNKTTKLLGRHILLDERNIHQIHLTTNNIY